MDELDDPPGPGTSSPSHRRAVIACGAAGFLVALVAGAVVTMRRLNHEAEPEGRNWWLVVLLVVALADSVAGAALLTRHDRRLVGGCLVVVGTSAAIAAVAIQSAAYADSKDLERMWLADAEGKPWQLGGAVLAALVPWQVLPRTWRDRGVCQAVLVLTGGAIAVLVASILGGVPSVEQAASWAVAASATAATVALAVAWWRIRSTGDPLPGWLFAGAVAAWVAVVPLSLDVEWRLPGRQVVWALFLLATVPLLVAGTVIGVLRDVPSRYHGISHRVLEWTILAGGIMVLYAGTVAGLGRLVGGSGPTWFLVATSGLVALLLEPARRHIRHLVDQLVYGARDDPLTVVQRVVDHLGADSGDDLLPALVRSLQEELRLDAVAIDLRVPNGWQRAAGTGPPTARRRVVELVHRNEVVGRLVVGWQDGPSLRARDEQVLEQLVGPLSLAVGWVRLASDLRRSSLAIVSAREEERRRLRRDLHDGLGPALTGVSLGLRTAVTQLDRASGPTTTRDLLDRVADEVDRVVVDVKRIVRDLRPTALDQLGLTGALSEFAHTLGDELQFHLTLPLAPVELPAAVEVATYRIVTEAVTNVVRHARAARCWLTVDAGATIEIDVADDGIGIPAGVGAGVGLTAMRERAAELGGSFRVMANWPRGTRVHVRLPAALP